jgi:hypothetical protein
VDKTSFVCADYLFNLRNNCWILVVIVSWNGNVYSTNYIEHGCNNSNFFPLFMVSFENGYLDSYCPKELKMNERKRIMRLKKWIYALAIAFALLSISIMFVAIGMNSILLALTATLSSVGTIGLFYLGVNARYYFEGDTNG